MAYYNAMNQEIYSKELFHQRLRAMWAERGFPLAEDGRIGISIDELIVKSAERNARRELPYIDLWVAILDECISWFVSLLSVVYAERAPVGGLSDFEKSTTLILSKIIADSIALRHLIMLGFDTSARTILRSLSEYMEVLVAILHKPDFSSEFIKSDSPETAQCFWEQHLRGGKIRRRVTAAWADFFQNDPTNAAIWFANWGRGSQPILSGITHPSSAGGLFAAIPLNGRYTDENWLGIWGDKADISVETIYIYVQYVFPVCLLSSPFPFEGYDEYIRRPYDQGNQLHRHVRIGRDILAGIILSVGSQTDTWSVFPELDMSIFSDLSEAGDDLA